MRQAAQPIARRLRNWHPFVAPAHLPPTAHPHLHTHRMHLPNSSKRDVSSLPNTSLTEPFNSCHARRTGCPPDEYSQHSIDRLTHIQTLVCKTRSPIYMRIKNLSTIFYEAYARKIFTVSILASFIYLLRMMNVSGA